MQTCPFTLIRRLPDNNQFFSVLCSVDSRSISRLFRDSAQLRTGCSSFSCDYKTFNWEENLGRVQYTRVLSSLTMSVFSLEVIAEPAHRVIVTSASIFFGCMGFVLVRPRKNEILVFKIYL
ncbi:uncharacterized protein C8R40DRAFT_1076373 [Lentinula edodes]|uniref:uncharacterized protein n=1 Tax=Lentinula edodes TaxID=5353 RepID=UPI001E8E8FB4|nr:uncharacterized protein C8R40DRAFT_1076373 [Lentinula edodes]KAH7881061.1 hypothetical protein C8R40DRAFT_1076373 [Lentinula edodes]